MPALGETAPLTPGFPWHPHRGIETITSVLEGDAAGLDAVSPGFRAFPVSLSGRQHSRRADLHNHIPGS